jgi:glycosyltransferase involved in cell wall biosynthesis
MSKLRIAFATPEYITEKHFDGGLANYLYRTATTLANLGHDVHVITLSQTEQAQFQHHGVTVHRLLLGKRWYAVNRFTRYQFPTALHWFNLSTRVYQKLRQLNAEQPFDIVQFPNYSYCGLFSILFSGIPHVLRASSDEPFFEDPEKEHTLDFKLLQLLEKIQYRRSRYVFLPSQGLREMLANKHAVRAEVIINAVDGQTDNPNSAVCDGLFPGREFILFFGRFERRKGFAVLAHALQEALSANEEMYAVLVGRDVATSEIPSMAGYARSLCREFGERLIVLDPLAHDQLYPIIARAKLVVLPSVIDNLPNACLEAMALGKVVIGTRESTLDEVIVDEENGFLVPAGDAEALRKKIVYAWHHSNLEAIGSAAKQKTLEFSREKAATALLNYYQRVIDDRRRHNA